MNKALALSISLFAAIAALFAFAVITQAEHSWGSYHWARTGNPFTLKLGDNVSTAWDSYLAAASVDWNASDVLDTSVVFGATNPKRCKAVSGRVEVCNSTYGKNGWLGIAQIFVSGNHIVAGMVKMNDTYFKTSTYNTPGWRQFVTCQEIGHTFGLDHQDENFGNSNIGTCMDYTNNPARDDGAGTNLHPNLHDFEELALIYAHPDTFSTISAASNAGAGASALARSDDFENASEWGKEIRKDSRGRSSLFARDLGRGEKVFTFVIWADPADK